MIDDSRRADSNLGSARSWFLGLGVLATCVSCARNEDWDRPFLRGDTVGLLGSVAVVDTHRDELMMLTSPRKNALALKRLRIGKNIVRALPSRDKNLLLVLSRGVVPRLQPDDEYPQLSVIGGGIEPEIIRQYHLDDPLRGLALDPQNE